MRILWVTGNYRPQLGGLENYVARMVEALAPRVDLGLLTEIRQGPAPAGCVAHLRVSPITYPESPGELRGAGRAIARAVADFAPAIVHLSNASVAVYRACLPRALPVVATVHGNDLTAPWQRTPGRDTVEAIVAGLDACERVLPVSHHTAGLVRRSGVRAPSTVIWPGCDAAFFRPDAAGDAAVRARHRVPPGVPMVLTVARLVPRKGHDVILQAIARMPYPVHWVVVGQGPRRAALERAAAASPAGGRVTFTGRVADADLLDLYRACDVFAMIPEERSAGGRLDSEGFGLVFLEAGACGKPVVGSSAAGCRDAIAEGESGILVPPRDPAALVAALRRVLEDRAFARALGEGGRRRAEASGWAAAAERVVEVYRNVAIEVESQRALTDAYRL